MPPHPAHHARTRSPEALGTALQGLENAALHSQVQRGAAAVVGVAHVRALQRQEAGDRGAHRQFCAGREARGLQLGADRGWKGWRASGEHQLPQPGAEGRRQGKPLREG